MDVCNVTEEYGQFIKSQKLTLQKAKKRKGQRPQDRKSKQQAYAGFMLALMMRRGEGNENLNQIYSSFIPPAYHPCTTPVAMLRRVYIADLQLETHHRGGYLLLRSITPPSRMTAILAIMEDEKGDAILVQLYQQEDEVARKAVDIVNVGTILLIKEPYFKVMGDGEYGLRVDHLSDVINLDKDDTKVPQKWQPRLTEIGHTAESLKLRGNTAVREERYRDAITL
jgi:hypothetical protein